jgi:hypothetical protein
MSTFDPDQYLSDEEKKYKPTRTPGSAAAVTDFDPDQYLSASGQPTAAVGSTAPAQEFGVGELAQMIAPAATSSQVQMVPTTVPVAPQAGGMGPPSQTTPVRAQMAPSGMQNLATSAYENVIKPAGQTAVDVVKSYPKRPFEMAADVALTAAGIGPVSGILRGGGGMLDVAKQAYQGAKTIATDLTALPAGTAERLAPSVKIVEDALSGPEKDALAKLSKQIGIEAAIQQFEFDPKRMADPKFSAAVADLRSVLPQKAPSLFSRLAAPVAKFGAKALGPVGMGMDIYQAQQFAQESELGPRLAQGQGRRAQQAFRNMAANQQYGGITPEQQRMLEQDQIDRDIRRKAAARVLGPIAPGR